MSGRGDGPVLVVGCGYTGERLARRLQASGHAVWTTTRGRERAARLRDRGLPALRLHLAPGRDAGEARGGGSEAAASEGVAWAAALGARGAFHLAPPAGSPAGAAEASLLESLAGSLERFVYVSSTSVYGDRGGAEVDESTPPRPDSEAGRTRLAVEAAVLAAAERHGVEAVVVRPAGIYGPGRALADALRDGRYRVLADAAPLANRIHVEDLVTALVAAWRRGRAGAVYNAVDDEPHPSGDFARLAARLLGTEVEEITVEEARRRYANGRLARKLGSKRVRNDRLRRELGVELRYPAYREGLPAALREEAEASRT